MDGAGQDLTGRAIGPYRLRERIAGDGRGDTYLAEHDAPGSEVAVRFLRIDLATDLERKEALRRSLVALMALDCPHIVPVRDFGASEVSPWPSFAAVPYVVTLNPRGETLRECLSDGPLAWERALHIVRALAVAVDHAHDRGVLDGNLHPGQIFLGDGDVPLIAWFGLAALHRQADASYVGDQDELAYLAPEHFQGRPLDARTDCYGLGALLYGLLTGRAPFAGASAIEVIAGVIAADAPYAPLRTVALPPGLEAILRRALAKDPADRFPSGRALVEALDASARSTEPQPPDARRHPAIARPRVAVVSQSTGIPNSPYWSQISATIRFDHEGAQIAVAYRREEGTHVAEAWEAVRGETEYRRCLAAAAATPLPLDRLLMGGGGSLSLAGEDGTVYGGYPANWGEWGNVLSTLDGRVAGAVETGGHLRRTLRSLFRR